MVFGSSYESVGKLSWSTLDLMATGRLAVTPGRTDKKTHVVFLASTKRWSLMENTLAPRSPASWTVN